MHHAARAAPPSRPRPLQVWVSAELDGAGRVRFAADSDAELSRGLAAVLVEGLSGLTPAEVVALDPSCLASLGLGPDVLTRSRANGFLNMLESMKRRARQLAGDLPTFPSLLITAAGTSAQGAFAEAQASRGGLAAGGDGAGWRWRARRERAGREGAAFIAVLLTASLLPLCRCSVVAPSLQNMFLQPDAAQVDALAAVLEAKKARG